MLRAYCTAGDISAVCAGAAAVWEGRGQPPPPGLWDGGGQFQLVVEQVVDRVMQYWAHLWIAVPPNACQETKHHSITCGRSSEIYLSFTPGQQAEEHAYHQHIQKDCQITQKFKFYRLSTLPRSPTEACRCALATTRLSASSSEYSASKKRVR